MTLAPALHSEIPLQFPSAPPTPPAEAEKAFEVLHGFQMQLIAAEPLVTSPVAITYDEDGRAFVCEMNDYPYTDKARHKASQENPTDQPIGKVRLLVDTDGDGAFDKSTIFAGGLSWPTGSVCWKGGVIVVATPDIWYFKDTDGDGVADVRRKLFTGLKKLNVQAVANNPIWGLDNKIYIAGGSNGGTLQNLVHPEQKPVTFRRNDLVLDPVAMTITLASGGARFGNTRDDWGNRFLCNIRNPLQHVVMDQRYLARNPYLPPVNPLADVAESGDQLPVYRISPPEQWRELRAKRWSADPAVTAHMPRSELVGAGVVTSSSGCTIYRGDAYPPEFRGMAFVCDVAGNLFYRLKLEPDGVTFKGTRIDGGKEFVASRDIWFRPVNFASAPDGTLTVCDMYREVIEHPWSLPDDIHAALDLERGRDSGRLYRLVPPIGPLSQSSPLNPMSGKPGNTAQGTVRATFKPRPTPQLGKVTTPDLVALLAHPNAWHRDTAHRLLFERGTSPPAAAVPAVTQASPPVGVAGVSPATSNKLSGETPQTPTGGTPVLRDQSAVPLLREMVEKNESPLARMEAMWVLEGIGSLSDDDLLSVLDPCPPKEGKPPATLSLLEHAIKLAEPRLAKSDQIKEFAACHMTNADIRLHVQVAFALGEQSDLEPLVIHATASTFTNVDPWMRMGLLSSARDRTDELLLRIIKKYPIARVSELIRDGAVVVGNQGKLDACARLLDAIARQYRQLPRSVWQDVLATLGNSTLRRGKALATISQSKDTKSWLTSVAINETKTALSVQSTVEDRTRAIALLALLEFPKLQPIAAKLLRPSEPDAIRVATIKLLGQQRDAKVADLLLEAWPTLTPAPREAALEAFAGRPHLSDALLSAIEEGRVKPAEISPTARTLMTKTADAKLGGRASKLFAGNASRQEVIARYQVALTLKGDAGAGHKVYQTICIACHRKGDEGRDIGSNLATVQAWTPEQLLTNILDPNREVAPNFLLYIVETNDGRILSGIITNETPASVSLKGADGAEQSVPRSEVRSLKSAGVSLMPEGVEMAVTAQQMADLMAFIRGS